MGRTSNKSLYNERESSAELDTHLDMDIEKKCSPFILKNLGSTDITEIERFMKTLDLTNTG